MSEEIEDVEMSMNDMNETKDDDEREENDKHDSERPSNEDEPAVKLTQLPIARVRKIAKTDPEIAMVNQDAIFLITKATEFFMASLATESYKYTQISKKKTVQKKDVVNAINNVDALLFLDGML